MLSLIDLKKAIVEKLKPLKINIIASEIKSGFKKPAFFVQLMPISNNTGINMQERVITVIINYFSDEKTDIANLKMIDALNNLFTNCIKVGDRYLTIYEKREEIEGNVLQYKFDFRFTESINKDSDNEFMLSSEFDMKFN